MKDKTFFGNFGTYLNLYYWTNSVRYLSNYITYSIK